MPTPTRATRPEVSHSLAEGDSFGELELEFLSDVVARSGVDPSCYRFDPLRRRLAACFRALHVSDVESALVALARNPSEWTQAINALLIGVTKFYRDRDVFDQLRDRWLPELLAASGGLNVWSVGTSCGAELYSVAALLAEQNGLAKSRLRGSDCRAAAIDLARRSRYCPTALSELPDGLRKYFHHDGSALVPDHRIRLATIDWRVEDALACRENSSWDVILCRNMAIYLEPRLAE